MFLGYVLCFHLIDNYTKTQLQRDIINVPDQQKTDAVLFIKGPVCRLDQRISLKLFAAGAATCLFSENKDAYRPIRVFYLGSKEQRYYSGSKKSDFFEAVLQFEAGTQQV